MCECKFSKRCGSWTVGNIQLVHYQSVGYSLVHLSEIEDNFISAWMKHRSVGSMEYEVGLVEQREIHVMFNVPSK